MFVYMRTHRLYIASLLAAIAIVSVFVSSAIAQDIRIGVLSHRGKETALRMWTPTAVYLSRKIPEHRFEIVPLDFNQIESTVGSGQVEFVITNPEIYVNLEAQYRVSRIATLKNMTSKGAYKEFGGVIFARADRNDIRSIHDMKGKRVMAVEANSLGGWTMAWREMKAAGVDPYRDFAGLSFGGAHDDVVYAVRDRKVDAGTVRSDTLERMANEGKINAADYYVVNRHKNDGEFPFAVSTRLYPEWPFAKVRHTPDDLAESVAIALFSLSADDTASKSANLEGWTIPLDYELVHALMRELRIGVYKDYGKITVSSVMRQYGYWFAGILLALAMYWNYSLWKMVRKRTLSLQQELEERRKTEQKLKHFSEQLEERVRERTAELEREVEERLKSEQAAIASEQRFRELFQNISDPVYISDMTGKIIAANARASLELGYSNQELLTKAILDLDAVYLSPELLAENFKILSETKALTLETIHRRKDGSRFPVEVNIRIIDFQGQAAVLGVARNLSERKLAEEQLKASEENYRCFTELTSDYVCKCSRKGTAPFRVQWVGGAAGSITGYSADEIYEMGCWLPFVHPDDKQAVASYFLGLVPGDRKQIEFRLITKQGEILWISERSRCEAGQGEGELILFGSSTDITERRRAEEERQNIEQQLLHSQKLESLGILAGGIAHDFNNILTAIIGNADLALMRVNRESPAVDNLHRIERAASRAADLARQMLAYSGKGKFLVESLDLNRLLEEMLHMLEVSISKKAVLRFNLHQPLPAVEADATQMRQIIMNLIINASEAIGNKSGVIGIATGCVECDRNYLKDVWLDENLSAGLYVYFEISDNGCGMDKDTMAKLFDPFFTTKFTGRGLGMAAVLGIVRGHKGAIKVHSEAGRGSSFKILLPVSAKPVENISRDDAPDEWRGSGTVLLVDDEETVRNVGSEMLKELGFKVITADDGRHAVETFKNSGDISFVILDLTMPHMDGEQCFRELRQINPDVKVIISSGYSENEVAPKFSGKGLAGFIQKPYKLSELKEAVRGMGRE